MNKVLFFNALKEQGNTNTMTREVFEGVYSNIYIYIFPQISKVNAQ